MKVKKQKKKFLTNKNLLIITVIAMLLILMLRIVLANTVPEEEESLINEYSKTYTVLSEYSSDDINDISYTTPLLTNYNYYYPENDYSEKEIINGIDLFDELFAEFKVFLPIYDAEIGQVYYEGELEETTSENDSESTTVSTIEDYSVNGVHTQITEPDEAIMFEFVLEVPRNENGSVSVSKELLNSIDDILLKYSVDEEAYTTISELIETTTYLNIVDDSETGFDIPILNYGDVTIEEEDIANSKLGQAYPVLDTSETGNLNICYQVPESGNYAFSQITDEDGDPVNESIYAIYDDYVDCIQSKYYLSKAVRQGYSQSKSGISSADGSISSTKDELYEVQPLKEGEYISISGIQIQKYSDNNTIE